MASCIKVHSVLIEQGLQISLRNFDRIPHGGARLVRRLARLKGMGLRPSASLAFTLRRLADVPLVRGLSVLGLFD